MWTNQAVHNVTKVAQFLLAAACLIFQVMYDNQSCVFTDNGGQQESRLCSQNKVAVCLAMHLQEVFLTEGAQNIHLITPELAEEWACTCYGLCTDPYVRLPSHEHREELVMERHAPPVHDGTVCPASSQ